MNDLPQNDARALADSRDHLYFASEAGGFVFWKPEGLLLYEKLRGFIRFEAKAFGAQEVKSPIVAPCSLFERSGHLDKYRDAMFFVSGAQSEPADPAARLALRPMSCPNHISIYASERRGWRELPLRLFEFGEVFRDEPSGALHSLWRGRQFCQDDWHVFMRGGDEASEAARWLGLAQSVYKRLGLSPELSLSLRPARRLGSDAAWDLAEASLRRACEASGLGFSESPGSGAFYGPKIELGARDRLGRLWQMGVFQLDCALPERFGLWLDGPEGRERPVLAHCAVLGSLERMIGLLLDAGGARGLPLFLRPREAAVLPVSAAFAEPARRVFDEVRALWPDAELDERSEPLGARVARARALGRAHWLVVGEREAREAQARGEPFASVGGRLVAVRGWLSAQRE
jgi:threonyl-tRNA synthetase